MSLCPKQHRSNQQHKPAHQLEWQFCGTPWRHQPANQPARSGNVSVLSPFLPLSHTYSDTFPPANPSWQTGLKHTPCQSWGCGTRRQQREWGCAETIEAVSLSSASPPVMITMFYKMAEDQREAAWSVASVSCRRSVASVCRTSFMDTPWRTLSAKTQCIIYVHTPSEACSHCHRQWLLFRPRSLCKLWCNKLQRLNEKELFQQQIKTVLGLG